MKKIFILSFITVSMAFSQSKCWADHFEDNFKDNLNTKTLDALAKDVGSLVGAGSFHTGKNLGFIPVGFDVGVHVPVVGLSNEDLILRDNGSQEHAIWGQGELGLPANLGLIIRGGKLENASMVGGGVRYAILSFSEPFLPSLSIEGLYGRTTHTLFNMNTYTGNAILSFNVPFVHPYIGGGYDYSTLNPTSKAFDEATSPDRSVKGSGGGYRAEVGINVSVIPFTYLTLGGGVSHGQKLYHGGIGINF